ncbi:MAG: hypothetical protein JSS65_08220 [Armatimonadetes bacterium]|nr:hypothetical protein [Armatimonadota bacterium]
MTRRPLIRTLVVATAAVSLAITVLAGPVREVAQMYLASGWRLAPAGTPTKVGDMLAGGEASPDGKWVAFASVGQGDHKVFLFDRRSGKLADTLAIGRGWVGMGWTADSRSLFVSGGTSTLVHRLSVSAQGKLAKDGQIPVVGPEKNKFWLSGLAVVGDSLVVASSASDMLVKVDLASGKSVATRALAAGDAPYQIRKAPGGHLLVSLQGSAQVAEVDPADLSVVKTIPTGRHPNDLAVGGGRLFVSCGNDDVVDVFDAATLAHEEKIVVRPWPDAPPGSTPNALALTPDGKWLFVALSDDNGVAAVDVSRRGRSVVQGFVPSGAYPSALATTADGRHLLVGSSKNLGTGPNGNTDKINPVVGTGYPYIVTLLNGAVYDVDVSETADLRQMTATFFEVSKYKPRMVEKPYSAPAKGSNPIPSVLGDASPIKHVLYIIKENRTYDQVFGDMTKGGKPYGNGDPKLCLFDESVTPNHHELARQYVLFDNLYASGEVSVDGHHWSNGAYVPDFMQRTWPQQYSGKGTPRLSTSLAETPTGRIWDQMREAGKSYRTYYYHTTDRQNADWAAARRKGVRDNESVDIFIDDFHKMEASKSVPAFMVMALSEDHTTGTRGGAFTPKACVASNDIGIGKIVEAVSHSSLWKEFAIFIIEDDAQNGADHVDAHRTVALVVSPFTRGMGVDSTHYTTTSLLRTMELIFGAKPMSQFDAAATPMYKAFKMKGNVTPYSCLNPQQDIMAKNPSGSENALLAAIDFSEPDQMTLEQEIAMNRAVWHSIKGATPYPGPVRRFGATVADNDD